MADATGKQPARLRSGRRSIWRQGDYLKLWSAETISQFGTQISFLGMPLIAVITLHAGPVALGLLRAIEFAPFLLIGLPAGVVVDRLRRRPVLIASDLGRAVVLLVLPVAAALGILQLWQLLVVSLLVGVLTVFFDVAYQAYLPALVTREDLTRGNAGLEISRSGAQIAGPGLAGLLIQLLTAPMAILLDAVSFVGSGALLAAIRRKEAPSSIGLQDGRPSMWHGIRSGLRFVFANHVLRGLATTSALINLGLSGIEALYVLYAVRTLGLHPSSIGLIFSVGNIGLLLGALSAARIAQRLGVGATLVGSVALQCLGLLLVPVAPHLGALPALMASQLTRSFGVVTWNVNQVSLRQAITPDPWLGRMTATMRFIGWGGLPLGGLLAGLTASLIGVQSTLWLAVAIGVIALLPVAGAPARARLPGRSASN